MTSGLGFLRSAGGDAGRGVDNADWVGDLFLDEDGRVIRPLEAQHASKGRCRVVDAGGRAMVACAVKPTTKIAVSRGAS